MKVKGNSEWSLKDKIFQKIIQKLGEIYTVICFKNQQNSGKVLFVYYWCRSMWGWCFL